MTISFKRLALVGGAAASAVALSASAHAEGWTGGYISVGVSGASSSADVSATVAGKDSIVTNKGALASSGTGATNTVTVTAASSSTPAYYGSGTSANVNEAVMTVANQVAGRANNRFRAGAIIEAGYDYEVGSNFVVGLNGSYNFSGTATNDGAVGLGQVSYTSQDGFLTFTAAPSPAKTVGSLGTALGTVDANDIYDLTSLGGTFKGVTGLTSAGTATSVTPVESATLATRARFKMGDNWSVGGRAGFAASKNLLVFAAGGYTQAKIGISAESVVLNANVNTKTDAITAPTAVAAKSVAVGDELTSLTTVAKTKWKDGYYLGGGFEAKVTGNITLKAEYRYSNYGSYSLEGTTKAVSLAKYTQDIRGDALSADVKTTVSAKSIQSHALRVSVAYRF